MLVVDRSEHGLGWNPIVYRSTLLQRNHSCGIAAWLIAVIIAITPIAELSCRSGLLELNLSEGRTFGYIAGLSQ